MLRHTLADPCDVVVAGHVAFVATGDGDQDDPTRMVIQEWSSGDGPKRVRLEEGGFEPGLQLNHARPTGHPAVYHVTAAFGADRLDHDRPLFAEFRTVRSRVSGTEFRFRMPEGRFRWQARLFAPVAIGSLRSYYGWRRQLRVSPLAQPGTWYPCNATARAPSSARLRAPALGAASAPRCGWSAMASRNGRPNRMQVIGGYYDVLHDVAVDTLRGR